LKRACFSGPFEINGRGMRRLLSIAGTAIGASIVATQLLGVPWSTAAGTATTVSSCESLRSPEKDVVALDVKKDWPELCITREGVAPDVRTALYVDGRLTGAFQEDACSSPNAAYSVQAVTVPLPDGRAIFWGTLPDATASLSSGDSTEILAYGPSNARVFATVISSSVDFRKVQPRGGAVGGVSSVAACGERVK
jgi:hypothetical protein